jgi:uncharacterized LabA/DUF88 family protein
MKSLAILHDGGFTRRRLYRLLGNRHPTADDILRLSAAICRGDEDLFRIYYYDCLPLEGTRRHPLLDEPVDFGRSPTANRMKSLLDRLAHSNHVAFRRGVIQFGGWGLNPRVAQSLLQSTESRLAEERTRLEIDIRLDLDDLERKGLISRAGLPKDDRAALSRLINLMVRPEIRQKRVDIKIGLDVAWLSSRRIVERIALVAGDTDFIPAMKFARREGVQVILVPLGSHPHPELVEHADEVRAVPFAPDA